MIGFCQEKASDWKCRKIYLLQQPDGWIDETIEPYYNMNSSSFLLILPVLQASVNRTFKHIGRVDGKGKPVMLTAGNFVVTEILSWDEDSQVVYFMGTRPNRPGERHFYSVDQNSAILCYTCRIKVSFTFNDC